MKKIAIILAGGNGKKFWPISNSNIPEQFVYLINNSTLFQKSVELIAPIFERESIYLVINNKFKELAIEQTNLIDEKNIFVEPLSMQTAPALGLALAHIDNYYNDDTIVCVFPTDQIIKNVEEYYYAINNASETAANLNALVTIGIKADKPITDFGYIQFADAKDDKKNIAIPSELFEKGIRKSINFAEKPDSETAQRFINSGDFIWNSGMLIATKKVLQSTYQKHLSYYYEKFQEIKKIFHKNHYYLELENLYQTFNKISIDNGILENAENVYVAKASFFWDDINSWEKFHMIEMKDAMDNVLQGNVIAVDTTNSLAISKDKLIAIMGLDDIVAVNTEKAILICKKSESNKIDKLVNYINNSGILQF